MPVISLMNLKGGVAKTTSTANLAAQAALKKRTLLIDTDHQCNLSTLFEVYEPETSILDAFTGKPFEVVNVRKNLDLLPAIEAFSDIELHLTSPLGREKKLMNAIEKLKDDYEYIFIDCPPSKNIVTLNAIVASDYVILPMKPEMDSIGGVEKMVELITEVREHGYNPAILGILLTQLEERTRVADKMFKAMEERGWSEHMFKTKIRKNTTIQESPFDHKTIFEYSKASTGAKDYMALGMEVLKKLKN